MLFFFLKDLAWVMCEKQCILIISFHPTAETKLLLLLKQRSVKQKMFSISFYKYFNEKQGNKSFIKFIAM